MAELKRRRAALNDNFARQGRAELARANQNDLAEIQTVQRRLAYTPVPVPEGQGSIFKHE